MSGDEIRRLTPAGIKSPVDVFYVDGMRAIANPGTEQGREISYKIKQNQILEPLWELVDKADDWKAHVNKLPFEDLIVLQERLSKFHDGKLIVTEDFSDHSDQIDYEYKIQVLREMYPYVNS